MRTVPLASDARSLGKIIDALSHDGLTDLSVMLSDLEIVGRLIRSGQMFSGIADTICGRVRVIV